MPGETRTVACRAVGEAVSDVMFVPSGEHDVAVEHITAPAALYQTDGDGFVYISVTNSSDHGLEFDRGDLILRGDIVRREDCHSVHEPAYLATLSTDEQAVANAIVQMASSTREGAREPLQGGGVLGGFGECNHSHGGKNGTTARPESDSTERVDVGGSASTATREHATIPAALPTLYNATFEQWLSNIKNPTYTIMSFDPSVWERDDVVPSVILYSGMGGMSTGAITYRDGKYCITVVAVESVDFVCATHRLNNPSVPVLRMHIDDHATLRRAISDYLPRRHWHRLWMHSSNSCKKASSANMVGRDIDAALKDTIKAIQAMQTFKPAVWTLENVAELHQFFKGKYPTAYVFDMKKHCALAQHRRRLILSNRTLFLKRVTHDVTVRHVLGERKGWLPATKYWMRNAWGYVRSVDSGRGSYTITSGHLQAGAEHVGDFGPQHALDSIDRALLQGFERPPAWPSAVSESARRAMVAQCVPPPFAEQLSIAAFGYQSAALERARLHARLAMLDATPDEQAATAKCELPSTWLSTTSEKVLMGEFAGFSRTDSDESRSDQLKLGKFGKWKCLGEYGWCKASVPSDEHIELVRSQPWLKCLHPPKTTESFVEFHQRRQREKLQQIDIMLENAQMAANDTHVTASGGDATVASKLSRHFVNVHPDADMLHKHDSNAELQRTNPELYGPYLAEGETYKTPRTRENWEKACRAVGLDDLSDEDKPEREFYANLLWELWVLFDDKLRAIAGVEVDLDLSDVKPIRAHPYRWSPAKVQAGRQLVQEFIDDGIIKPITSEWGAPALIVPKKNGYRLVVDLRELNKHIPHDTYEPPSCDLCLEWLSGKPYRTTADMRWGFHQVLLSKRAQKIFTFVTPFGTFAYQRLVMGYINATAEFQRHINNTLGPLLWDTCLAMVDDLCIASETKEEHRVHVTAVLTALAQRHHSIKASKMHILRKIIEYLGHMSTPHGTQPTSKHIDAIVCMPAPLGDDGLVDKTRVRSFLGMVKFVRRYIPKCGLLCDPLNQLTCDESDGVWTAIHRMVMARLKDHIAFTRGVWHADFSKPLYICCDGSKRGVGGYLFQKIDNEERVISYFSRATTRDERKWDTRELEVLALISTLEYFRNYIDGQPVMVDTDHQNITWLSKLKGRTDRLGRWVLRLSEFQAKISWRKGKYMDIADCLSRNSQPSDEGDEPEQSAVTDLVPKATALITEVNPGDAGVAPTFRASEFIGDEPVIDRVPSLYIADFTSVIDECEHALENDFAITALTSSKLDDDTVAEADHPAFSGGEEESFCGEDFDVFAGASTPSREGSWRSSRAVSGYDCTHESELLHHVATSTEDEPTADEAPLVLPESLLPDLVSMEAIRREQGRDSFAVDLLKQLSETEGDFVTRDEGRAPRSGASLRLAKFASLDGILFRITEASDPREGFDSARVYVPPSLRDKVIRSRHSGVFGAHRNAKATQRELVSLYWWPSLSHDVEQFVRRCRHCELAKGFKPSRQGFLQGWRHSSVMHAVTMDLIGPIGSRQSGHVKHPQPLHILVITDPFSHMVWLEAINGKSAEDVFYRFVKNFLLEEGAPHFILTDRGREFDNEILKGLMELLKVRLRYTPSYHPRGNYTERVNRFVGESLRAMVNMDGAKQADWWKLTKFVEFAYRRMYIPGTNLTPFMVARGRQPSLPDELERWVMGDSLPSMPSLASHVRELTENMQLASQLLRRARDQQLARSREQFNQHQIETVFVPGERVRLWKRVPIRRKDGSEEIASKLKLFNREYEVVRKEGTRYYIRDVITGKETDVHVSQIARMRSAIGDGDEALTPEINDGDSENHLQLENGTYCAIWVKTDCKSVVRILEVLEINTEDQSFLGWYYIHSGSGQFDPELPLVERRLMPEWAHNKTQRRAKPAPSQEHNYTKIFGEFGFSEVEVIVPSFHLQSGGKIPEPVCRKVDTWLRKGAKRSPRAILAVSFPSPQETTKQAAFRKRK